MGASLVAAALVNVCPSLGRNHASRVALLIMANTALDKAAQPEYFAGWQPIARALGLAGTERSQHHRVRVILNELLDQGVIEKVGHETAGKNARYRLNLWHLRLIHNVDNQADNDPEPVDNSDVVTGVVWS